MKEKTAKPILSQLRNMQLNQTLTFPASKTSYIKAACSQFGFEWDKDFSTHMNKKARTIEVVRKR